METTCIELVCKKPAQATCLVIQVVIHLDNLCVFVLCGVVWRCVLFCVVLFFVCCVLCCSVLCFWLSLSLSKLNNPRIFFSLCRLWGSSNVLYCYKCRCYFPCTDLAHCQYHSSPAEYKTKSENNSVGTYPCCQQNALLYDPVGVFTVS